MVLFLSIWLVYWSLEADILLPPTNLPPRIVLQDADGLYSIGRQLALWEDTSARLPLMQVIKMDSLFQSSQQEIPAFAPSSSAIWCRLRVENKVEQDWYLEINAPFIDSIDVYASTVHGTFKHLQLGTRYPFRQRPVLVNQFIIPLEIERESIRTYYLRFSSTSTLKLPLTIASMQHLYERNHRKDVVYGMYFGLVLTLILYNLFVFILLKDFTYLYYILYVSGLALTIGYIQGYTFEFLTPDWPWVSHLGLTYTLAIVSLVLFTDSFLRLRYYAPKLRVLHILLLLLALADLILTLKVSRLAGFRIVIFTSSLILMYVFVLGLAAYYKGFKPARFYLLGFGILAICILIYTLMDFNVLPSLAWIENLTIIGSGLEVTVLSFALADKLNTYKQEKEQAQVSALAQATQFSHQLIQSQEHERKRIAAELHDSIGQNLILIKNKLLMLRNKLLSPEKSCQQIEDITHLVGNTIGEVRSISYGLRPFQLDMLGLSQSIRSLAEEVAASSGIDFTIEIEDIDSLLNKEEEINLYRIVQESLNNLVKHAHASRASFRLKWQDHTLHLCVEDNGIGMAQDLPNKPAQSGFGLIGLQERLKILRGTLSIHTTEKRAGTVLDIKIPTIYEKH